MFIQGNTTDDKDCISSAIRRIISNMVYDLWNCDLQNVDDNWNSHTYLYIILLSDIS